MKKRYNHNYMIIFIIIAVIILFVASQFLYLRFAGTSVSVPDIPRQAQVYGEGKTLSYVVMGDSITVGQGGDYDKGVAQETARHLAKHQKVTMYNVGKSGARAADMSQIQVASAIEHKPDVVLMVVGSNDITHLTSIKSIDQSIQVTVDKLIATNCNVKIVLTGAGDMGAVLRIPQPLRWLAGQRVKTVNARFTEIIERNKLTYAPVAVKTGDIFRNDSSLFAPDKFHPNDKGYAVWSTVLIESLDEALASQPSHCK